MLNLSNEFAPRYHLLSLLFCRVRAGGMLALGAKKPNDFWFQLGANLTSTCHLSYATSETHLGPEVFSFTDSVEAVSVRAGDKHYLLRPEVVESYFYMWRLTKDKKYREWAWDMVQVCALVV